MRRLIISNSGRERWHGSIFLQSVPSPVPDWLLLFCCVPNYIGVSFEGFLFVFNSLEPDFNFLCMSSCTKSTTRKCATLQWNVHVCYCLYLELFLCHGIWSEWVSELLLRWLARWHSRLIIYLQCCIGIALYLVWSTSVPAVITCESHRGWLQS